jgi:hypothetical protein
MHNIAVKNQFLHCQTKKNIQLSAPKIEPERTINNISLTGIAWFYPIVGHLKRQNAIQMTLKHPYSLQSYPSNRLENEQIDKLISGIVSIGYFKHPHPQPFSRKREKGDFKLRWDSRGL